MDIRRSFTYGGVIPLDAAMSSPYPTILAADHDGRGRAEGAEGV